MLLLKTTMRNGQIKTKESKRAWRRLGVGRSGVEVVLALASIIGIKMGHLLDSKEAIGDMTERIIKIIFVEATRTFEEDKPNCFGKHRSPQADAENDCDRCEHNASCKKEWTDAKSGREKALSNNTNRKGESDVRNVKSNSETHVSKRRMQNLSYPSLV